MMGRRLFANGLLGAVTLTALSGCGPSAQDTAELRYRLTVEVDTPQGPRSGSSVIAVKAVRNPDWVNPEGRGNRTSFTGEAAAVDLPGGRTLFALLKTDGGASEASDYPWLAFQDRLREKDDLVASYQRLGRSSASAPMRRTEMTLPNGGTEVSALPMLVTFGDIKDPTSVASVDPDDLAASFGEGVKLKAITVEITDDPVTSGIEGRLPKTTNKGFFNWDGQSNPNEGNVFGIWDFMQGNSK
jgi:hypothetical protein